MSEHVKRYNNGAKRALTFWSLCVKRFKPPGKREKEASGHKCGVNKQTGQYQHQHHAVKHICSPHVASEGNLPKIIQSIKHKKLSFSNSLPHIYFHLLSTLI